MSHTFFIKGDFISADQKDRLSERPDAYMKVEDGRVAGFFPEADPGAAVLDYTGKLIIPSFTDMHVHAAQFPNMGLGMDLPLLPWLEKYTFPLEARYSDPAYARLVYPRFIHALWENGSLRSCIYSSIHRESTEILMDLLIEAGLSAFVGKVNMNRNTSAELTETLENSLGETRRWLERYAKVSSLVRPILTPRFVPTCTPELMRGLGELAREFDVPVQSHLNENRDEVSWVRELHPESQTYFGVYSDNDLVKNHSTIMAHCIYNEEAEEIEFADREVFLAHCPTSNLNMASGMMPASKLLRKGNINIAIGTDVAGGNTMSMARCIMTAMQVSNMRFVLNKDEAPLTLAEAFWMGTRAGGKFFGQCGDFTEGAACDLLVIDDSQARLIQQMDLSDRLSRFLFAGESNEIQVRMLEGRIIPEPSKIFIDSRENAV